MTFNPTFLPNLTYKSVSGSLAKDGWKLHGSLTRRQNNCKGNKFVTTMMLSNSTNLCIQTGLTSCQDCEDQVCEFVTDTHPEEII